MNIVISKEELVRLIGKLQSIVPARPSIAVLANVLMEAKDDQLTLSASDLTVSARVYAGEAKIIEEGAIALPARRFFQLSREILSPQIKITTKEEDVAEIRAGNSYFKIHGMNQSGFPELPELTNSVYFSVPSKKLKEMLVKTAFSAMKEDTRYILGGVLVKILGQEATFIATDGKRLSRLSTKIDIDPSFQGSYALPMKAVDEIIKTLDDSEEAASFSFLPDKASLEFGSTTLTTKLLSGQYPDVEKVIPKSSTYSLTLHREELITLLKQVSLFTSESSTSVRFIFHEGELILAASSSDIGEGKTSMPVNYSGEKLEIAFNPFYFLDILRHSQDDTVQFRASDSYNPGIITDSSSSALYVIMPMRLTDLAEAADVSEKPAFA